MHQTTKTIAILTGISLMCVVIYAYERSRQTYDPTVQCNGKAEPAYSQCLNQISFAMSAGD